MSCAEEFQMNHVAPLPFFLSTGYTHWLPSQEYLQAGGRQLHSRGSDKQQLGQAIKVNVSEHKSCWRAHPWHKGVRTALYLCDRLPQNHDLHTTMRRNIRHISTEGDPTQCLTSAPQNCHGRKTSESLRSCHSQRSLRRHDKYMWRGHWMGPWNSKRILGKN